MITPENKSELPKLHRIQGDFTLMDSDKKEFFHVSHAVLDELCHRSNSFPALLAALEGMLKAGQHIDLSQGLTFNAIFADQSNAARAAIAAAKAP